MDQIQRILNNDFKSEFLDTESQAQESFNLRDKLGHRLPDWQPGDTIMSVALRRAKNRIIWALNPNTYTHAQSRQIQQKAKLYNVYIFLSFVIILTPLALYVSYTLPRIQKAKRQFYMHQYQKLNILSRMGIKQVKMDLNTLKKKLHSKEDQMLTYLKVESVFEILCTEELKNLQLEDVYSVGPLEQASQSFDEEEILAVEQILQEPIVQYQPVVVKQPKVMTLDELRNFDIHHPQLNLHILAETQAELEVFLNRNQFIYKQLKLFKDHLRYSHFYQKEDGTVALVKRAMILLSEWMLAVLQLRMVKKYIYVHAVTEPRFQYMTSVVLTYKNDNGRQSAQRETLIAANENMAFILAEGWVLATVLTMFVFQMKSEVTLKTVLMQLRDSSTVQHEKFNELLNLNRSYFSSI